MIMARMVKKDGVKGKGDQSIIVDNNNKVATSCCVPFEELCAITLPGSERYFCIQWPHGRLAT